MSLRDVAELVRPDPVDGGMTPLDAYASHLVALETLARYDAQRLTDLRDCIAREARAALALCRECRVPTPEKR